jgi:hypothetical protein
MNHIGHVLLDEADKVASAFDFFNGVLGTLAY